MAIGWMTALKVIPWGDVIEATPGIVKGARKIFTRSQEADVPPASPGDSLQSQVAQLEARVTQLAEQQTASAKLIETLAEQNARIVAAVDILRVRTRLLLVVSGVLAVLLVAALAAPFVWGGR
jgi:Tfp pilus assembly protein FimV